MDTVIYDLLAVASLTFHELDCQYTEDARSVMLHRLLGTLFLSVSRPMHCLCLTVGTSSDTSTSRPTSTPNLLEVFKVDALYKFATYSLGYLLTQGGGKTRLEQTESCSEFWVLGVGLWAHIAAWAYGAVLYRPAPLWYWYWYLLGFQVASKQLCRTFEGCK